MNSRLNFSLFLFIIVLLQVGRLNAQEYFSNNILKDGVYIEHADYVVNSPNYQLIERNFNTLLVKDSLGDTLDLQASQVWAFSSNNNVYISYEDAFWKLINSGKLNHFTAIVLRSYRIIDPYGFPVEKVSKSLVHFFFERQRGEILYLNKENMNKYMEEDTDLKKYYKKLKGNKTERLILTLKAYNQRNP